MPTMSSVPRTILRTKEVFLFIRQICQFRIEGNLNEKSTFKLKSEFSRAMTAAWVRFDKVKVRSVPEGYAKLNIFFPAK